MKMGMEMGGWERGGVGIVIIAVRKDSRRSSSSSTGGRSGAIRS